MKQHFLLFVLSFTFLSAYTQADKTKSIDSLIKEANRIGIFNGNILIKKDDKIIYQNEIGFADTTKTRLLQPDSRFAIGSITKEFTNVGILLLEEQQKLKIDDKVSKYLPVLPKWADSIQITNLLQYTSGLPASGADTDSLYMQHLMNLGKLEFKPGTSYDYTNDNIFIQRKIIENVSGISYDSFIKIHFFEPLEMKGVLINSSTKNTSIAQSFDNDFNQTTTYQGNNELYLGMEDMLKWCVAIDKYKIISKHSMLELSKNFAGREGSLGAVKFENDSLKLHVHQGSGNNYEALLYSDEESNLLIILLTNNQNFKVNQLKDAIINILNDRPYIVPKKSIYLDIRKKLLDNFNRGIAFYNEIKAHEQDKYDWASEALDLYSTGKYLMRRNRFDDAITIFQLSILADVKNTGGMSFAFTLIGDCYLKNNNNELAIIYYRKALELDSTNKTAEGMIKKLSGDLQ